MKQTLPSVEVTLVTFLQPANMRTSQEYISEYFCVRNSHTSASALYCWYARGSPPSGAAEWNSYTGADTSQILSHRL